MLEDFLAQKPLYYDEIDYERMPRVYARIKSALPSPKIIHIIGTNGKGTTGRFLATALKNSAHRVGHYTSPHIAEFGERIWVDGANATKKMLDSVHQELQILLTQDESDMLSYFEYTTFLAMLLFKDMEYVVLEAGLGGERDATAVFEKILTLVTPIAKDHEDFLGDTITAIATTKLNAINNTAIVARQNYVEVYGIIEKISKKKGFTYCKIENCLQKKHKQLALTIANNLELPTYLKENLEVALEALNYLDIEVFVKDFQDAKLFGRMTKVCKNVIVDVGHNLLAAQAVVKSLNKKRYIVVYNTYCDKDYVSILETLSPIIKRVEIIAIDDRRIVEKQVLQQSLKSLAIDFTSYKGVLNNEDYLVFGSFKVVEAFLKDFHGGSLYNHNQR